MSAQAAKALCLHGALLWATTAWSGFSMLFDDIFNPKLLLTAHNKGFLHSFSLFGFGATAFMGCFPNLSAKSANRAFILLAGGSWVSLVADTYAAYANSTLPLGAASTGAAVDPDSFHATMIKLSAMAMAVGAVMMCMGCDKTLLTGGKAK